VAIVGPLCHEELKGTPGRVLPHSQRRAEAYIVSARQWRPSGPQVSQWVCRTLQRRRSNTVGGQAWRPESRSRSRSRLPERAGRGTDAVPDP
jgi:hypothetical protein